MIYKSLPLAMASALWLIHSARTTVHVLHPVWASALACTLNTGVVDNNKLMWACYPLYVSLPLLAWTLYLTAITAANTASTPLQILVLLILLAGFVTLAILDVVDTLGAFDQASKYDAGLDEVVEYRGEEPPEQDPVSMRGYKFLVWNNITTEEIWERMGTTRLSPDTNCADIERFKDTCLSYAFFRLILMKFAGSGSERSDSMTRRFILEGLITNHEDPKRLFRVIEVELGFLFDFFFTKSPVYRPFSFRHCVGLTALVVLVILGPYGLPMLADDMECEGKWTGTIQLVMVVYILIWFKNFLLGSSPNSIMVWRLCQGWPSVESARRLQQLIYSPDTNFLYWIARLFGNKPWQREIGQYSFLESYGKSPILSRKLFSPLTVVAKLPRLGQYGAYTVPLSDHVKRAIVRSLSRHVQDEAQPRSLRQMFEYMVTSSDAHKILVWHIATRFYESLIPPNDNGEDADDILVATQISNYCAYLLAFCPEILPGESHYTERFFNNAVEQVLDLRMQDLNVGGLYQRLINIEAIAGENTVIQGAALARRLMTDQTIGWRVMAEFWSDLLLYLAPSENMEAHKEYLARGGEFITHVWALVVHLGIVRH